MEFVRFLKMKENKYVCVINKITYHISWRRNTLFVFLLLVFLWPSQALDEIMYHKI